MLFRTHDSRIDDVLQHNACILQVLQRLDAKLDRIAARILADAEERDARRPDPDLRCPPSLVLLDLLQHLHEAAKDDMAYTAQHLDEASRKILELELVATDEAVKIWREHCFREDARREQADREVRHKIVCKLETNWPGTDVARLLRDDVRDDGQIVSSVPY